MPSLRYSPFRLPEKGAGDHAVLLKAALNLPGMVRAGGDAVRVAGVPAPNFDVRPWEHVGRRVATSSVGPRVAGATRRL